MLVDDIGVTSLDFDGSRFVDFDRSYRDHKFLFSYLWSLCVPGLHAFPQLPATVPMTLPLEPVILSKIHSLNGKHCKDSLYTRTQRPH